MHQSAVCTLTNRLGICVIHAFSYQNLYPTAYFLFNALKVKKTKSVKIIINSSDVKKHQKASSYKIYICILVIDVL